MSAGKLSAARRGLTALRTLTDNSPSSDALRAWPGWGPLAPAFDPRPDESWAAIHEELSDLLSAEEMIGAAEAVDNSFYTPNVVIDACFRLLRAGGCTGGKILEPGCGSGRFMARTPADWNVQWTGIEKDPVSARIAARLHPEADILTGRLEKLAVPHDQDAVIGNVPFSETTVYDPAEGISDNLHNYFVRRSLRLLREGGYLVVVTSRYALDSQRRQALPDVVDDEADFVGALMLPTGTFRSDGTDAVADIVVFRKNTSRAHAGWLQTVQESFDTRGNPCLTTPARSNPNLSAYWQDHPSHIAGEIRKTGNYRSPVAVVADDIPAAITYATDLLAAQCRNIPVFEANTIPALEASPEDCGTEGSFRLVDDQIFRVENQCLVPVRQSSELRSLIALRDLAVELVAAEADLDAPDDSLIPLRSRTLAAYRAYCATYGPLNRGTLSEGKIDSETGMPSLTWKRPALGGFRKDPDQYTVMALEVFDQETGTSEPAPILLRRVNRRPQPATSAGSPAEALSICLGEKGAVDLGRICALLGVPSEQAALSALGELVFRDPCGSTILPADDYLSGNVRQKLKAARDATERDQQYARNVSALESVVPADLEPTQILVSFGNPVLSTSDLRDFCEQVIGAPASIEHCEATSGWEVSSFSTPAQATTIWGTTRLNAYQLIQCGLNGRAPVVYDIVTTEGGHEKKVRNPSDTMAAQDKMTQLSDRLAIWVHEDPDRSARICADYNRRFNSFVPRTSDGTHLSFPGLSGGLPPHPWQRNMVDMAVSTPAVLCGHCVGAGKTLTMILASRALKQFGLAHKPLIVCPNHLLEQIAREAMQAFPMGRYLIATKEDLSKGGRRAFAARCATGDWDAVVMTHQAFTSLPVAPHVEQRWLLEQKHQLNDALRSSTSYFGAKEIARRLRSLETKLEKARSSHSTDETQVLFDHLGVDYIAVDEAHLAKRLDTHSRMEGFSLGSSKRATDLLLKAEAIAGTKPGKPYLGLYTGTPWTNSLAETFVWQRFIQPQVLTDAGVADFDTWASVFVKRETVVEVAPDGSGFRTVTRPTRMQNLTDLKTMLAQVADILRPEDIGLERPRQETVNIAVDQSPKQSAYVRALVERAENCRGGIGGKDNILVICGDGRRVALDPRLVGVDEDSTKLEAVASNIATRHRRHRMRDYDGSSLPGALQIAFCDIGTPGKAKGSQSYGRLRDLLIADGVPAERIRMIHEAKDDKARAALFQACRSGEVSVLLGSTEKLGLGTNIQRRLVAVHHVDPPWRPSDIEQRNGRALRPGNLNEEVAIVRYVTQRSFDSYTWQLLERKATGFEAMYDRSSTLREVDDIGDVVPDYTTMKALATGNPLLLEQAQLTQQVSRLRMLRAVDRQSVIAAEKNLKQMKRDRDLLTQRLNSLVVAASHPDAGDTSGSVFEHLVTGARNSCDYNYSSSWVYRGIEFRMAGTRGKPRMEVLHGYLELGDIAITKKGALRTGNVSRAASMLQCLADDWLSNIGALEASMHGQLQRMDEAMPQLQDVVDNFRWPHESELAAAEAKLATINSSIQTEADRQEAA